MSGLAISAPSPPPGSHAFTALCIYGEFYMFNISQESLPMVGVTYGMYSKHRLHIYGTVYLKVGKYRLLQ